MAKRRGRFKGLSIGTSTFTITIQIAGSTAVSTSKATATERAVPAAARPFPQSGAEQWLIFVEPIYGNYQRFTASYA
jgi:hypothetical protein